MEKTINRNYYPKDNKTYLSKDIKIKEYFKIIGNTLKKKFKNKNFTLLDAGCASGDFLYYLNTILNLNGFGIDFSKKLIELAKKKNPEFLFKVKDLKKNLNLKKFNVCSCLGTLSAFDDPFKIINKLVKLTTNNGKIIIFDLINEDDVNVKVRYQNNFINNTNWLSAFNTFSKKKWVTELKKNKSIKKIFFKKFNIQINIVKDKKKPMNTWTVNLNNKKEIMVGTGQILTYYIIYLDIK